MIITSSLLLQIMLPTFVTLYKSLIIMGKGDVKSKKGKIWRGSYGKKRPAKDKKVEFEKK